MSWFWGKRQVADVDEQQPHHTINDENTDDESMHDNDNNVDGLLNKEMTSPGDQPINHDSILLPSEESSPLVDNDGESSFDDNDKVEQNIPHHMSADSMTTDEEEDDVSLIDESSEVESLDEDFLESSSSSFDDDSDEEDDEDIDSDRQNMSQSSTEQERGKPLVIASDSSRKSAESDDDDDEQIPTSFWEKQSLLVLAAEHDRVDILNAILADDDENKEKLMNSGVPPLHLAITYGSVNATVALLRMGADPSVRPVLDAILAQQKDQPEDSKVEIPNIQRFDGVSAWELAFGNKHYEKMQMTKKSTSWSLFNSSSSLGANASDPVSGKRVIKPVDMALSKREGVRHAFTAEALRSVGGDEVERLEQLINSGMPATIDIGGKDLYDWSVEMGALQCEELLRPAEAAKYDESRSASSNDNDTEPDEEGRKNFLEDEPELGRQNSSFVIHRPADETIPQMKNKLDELESLSTALSTCLDNLAEEVSVCHGLLLMGGGAAALASHVKSLKALKEQKISQLQFSQIECQEMETDLLDLVYSSGDIGREIAEMEAFRFQNGHKKSLSEAAKEDTGDEQERKALAAQIAASENKIRKLRASIADLSEENIRDLKEVERRGLEGGINLVRGLREELRDIDYQLTEIGSRKAECKTKISMIHAKIPNIQRTDILHQNLVGNSSKGLTYSLPSDDSNASSIHELDVHGEQDDTITKIRKHVESTVDTRLPNSNNSTTQRFNTMSETFDNKVAPHNGQSSNVQVDTSLNGEVEDGIIFESAVDGEKKQKTPSEKIVTGDSQAIAIIQPGNRGFFSLDLWQVLLRIIGFDRAAYRRGVQVATSSGSSGSSSQPNVMIV